MRDRLAARRSTFGGEELRVVYASWIRATMARAAALEREGRLISPRRLLGGKVFAQPAAYAAAISAWLARNDDVLPEYMRSAERARRSYGENLTRARSSKSSVRCWARQSPAPGARSSVNNLLDLEGALLATDPSARGHVAIVKHTTPCGLAVGRDALDAYRKALACDPVSAFGSVISLTVPVDEAAAEAISSLFVECIVAPNFSAAAVEILGPKYNLRVLQGTAPWTPGSADLKRVRGGVWVQERSPVAARTDVAMVNRRATTDDERDDLLFAWCRSAGESNAIVRARWCDDWYRAGQISRAMPRFSPCTRAGGGQSSREQYWVRMRLPPRRVDQAAKRHFRIVQPGLVATPKDRRRDEPGWLWWFTGRGV